MRKRNLLYISLILSLALVACQKKEGEAGKRVPEKGDAAVDVTLHNLEGKTVTLSQLKEKVVILNFWATWCPPCREEMPSMEALYKKFYKIETPEKKEAKKRKVVDNKKKAKNKDIYEVKTSEGKKPKETDFVMLLVSIDEDMETVRDFIKRNNYTMPVYHDPGKEAGSVYGITGVPETFIIDKKGVIAEKVVGPLDWMKPEVTEFIEDLLKK